MEDCLHDAGMLSHTVRYRCWILANRLDRFGWFQTDVSLEIFIVLS
uniref:Uncharacterized protein n=1 Tax=Beet black scorch virus TaxID=196375 RepID=B3U3M2_9TOMB|nr:5K hypothetical protein 5B [Beet black scorch virus]UOF88540.1 ORF6 [Beet black scorch virus]